MSDEKQSADAPAPPAPPAPEPGASEATASPVEADQPIETAASAPEAGLDTPIDQPPALDDLAGKTEPPAAASEDGDARTTPITPIPPHAAAEDAPDPGIDSVSIASASIPPTATPKAAPKERVLVKGPKGTAVIGVESPFAKSSDAKGPRGTEVMGIQRPVLPPKKRIDDEETSERTFEGLHAERTSSQDLSHLAAVERGRRTQAIIGVLAGALLALLIGVALFVVVSKKSEASSSGTGTASTVAKSAVETASAPTEMSATASASAPLPTKDLAAVAALEKLRGTIDGCMRRLHALPGTSPAIPSSLGMLQKGDYTPGIRDWNSPFFGCTGFKITEPMGFVLQWQFHRETKQGSGIVWIDEDRDGTADRAYAFNARPKGRDAVEYDPIQPIAATTSLEKLK